jgi:hypothetical protein
MRTKRDNKDDARDQAFWSALNQSLTDAPPIDFVEDGEWQYGFLLARRIQGILTEHKYNPAQVKPSTFNKTVGDFADREGTDSDDLLEDFFDKWSKVKVPEGGDPVRAAAAKADGHTALSGDWPTERQRLLAARIYETALTLAGGVGGTFFASCRKLAEVLGAERMSVSRALNQLVATEYFAKEGIATTIKAQRFKVLK